MCDTNARVLDSYCEHIAAKTDDNVNDSDPDAGSSLHDTGEATL